MQSTCIKNIKSYIFNRRGDTITGTISTNLTVLVPQELQTTYILNIKSSCSRATGGMVFRFPEHQLLCSRARWGYSVQVS